MSAENIISLVSALCVSGGVIYLVVQKLFERAKDKAEVRQQDTESKRATVEFGIPMIQIYNEIDKIVESKTAPIKEKLDTALDKIEILEENACFKKECVSRVTKKSYLERLGNEASKITCKD